MSLTLEEQETGICYSNGSDIAIVYTANVPLKNKLEKLCKQFPKEFKRVILVGDDEDIKSYHINKRYININAPRQYSDEAKKAMIEQGKRLAAKTIAVGKTPPNSNKKVKSV